MFYIDVGKDLHVRCAEDRAFAQQIVRDALNQTLIRDACTAKDIDANETRAGSLRHGERTSTIVPQDVDPQRQIDGFADLRTRAWSSAR